MSRNFITVRCPNKANHSTQSDLTETVLFLPGAGYTDYAFNCQHAGCRHISTSDFFRITGADQIVDLQGMENLDDEPEDIKQAFALERLADQTRRGVSPIAGPRFERDKNGKIKWTSPNVCEAMRHPEVGGFHVSFDTFLHQIIVAPVADQSSREIGPIRPVRDRDYKVALNRLAGPGGFISTGYHLQMVKDAFQVVSEEPGRIVDSALNWIVQLPGWDGVPRVHSFCAAYLGAEDTPYTQSVSRYLWSALAGRIFEPGCQADSIVVFISKQGTGKTSSVRALCPNPDWFCELSLHDKPADISRMMRGKLIGELAELQGLFGKSTDSTKAWVSRRTEAWIPKFLEHETTFKRRLVIIGTTNNEEFLADDTGNRRWLPVKVGSHLAVDRIERDRDQLWAEAVQLWRQNGIVWREAQSLVTHEHDEFEVRDPAWEERVAAWLREEGLGGERMGELEYLTISQVLEEALRLDPGKQQIRDQHRVARVLKKLGYEKHRMRVDGRIMKVWKRIEES